MGKKHLNLTIDADVHQQAKDRGINVSSICEDALRQIVGTFDRSINPETCDHAFTLPFSVPSGLAKECKKCGKIKRVFVESHEETMRKCEKDIREKHLEKQLEEIGDEIR